MKCLDDIKKGKNLSYIAEDDLCMLVSSHLDRANIKHEVAKAIFYKSKAFQPMLFDENTMIVPITSEIICKCIIFDLNNLLYELHSF